MIQQTLMTQYKPVLNMLRIFSLTIIGVVIRRRCFFHPTGGVVEKPTARLWVISQPD
jgi:hypothetical protein